MKNRVLLIFLAVVLVVSLVAFAACKTEEAPPVVEEEVEEEEVEEEEVWQWPDKILVVTDSGVGLAARTGYVSLMSKDTGTTIRLVTRPGSTTAFMWIQQGRCFLASEGTSLLANVLEGIGGYATREGGPFQMRVVYTFSLSNAGFLVRGDSDIKTIYDIKPGTRIVDLANVPGSWVWTQGLLAWAGVDEADIIRVPVSTRWPAAVTDGRADICFYFPESPLTYELEATPHGIGWLGLNAEEDPEGAKRFLEYQPICAFAPMKQGPPSSQGVWGVALLCAHITRAESDPELVYHFAKWLDENYDQYKDTHAWNLHVTMDNLMTIVETGFIPVHDGLIKYLEEKGLWTAAHDARQEQNVELMTRYIEAYGEALDMADERGIMVDTANEEWIELWENYKKQLGLPRFKMFAGLEE